MSKAILLGDLHFGCHTFELEKRLHVAREYFQEFFFPLMERHYQPGDIVYILGDVFDNRNYLDIRVMCFALDLFAEFRKRGIMIRLLIGNHDMFGEKSYEFTSVRCLEHFDNITIYTKPTVVTQDNLRFLLMPWITEKSEELTVLREYANQVDFLFCHSDLSGAKTNMKTVLTHGLAPEDFVAYPRVYSGHIHIRQTIRNFTFVGSPYHLDRNDKGNKKGVYILDLATGDEQFYPNDFSPEYKTLHINTSEDIKKLDMLIESENTKGDWFDVEVSNSLIIKDKTITKKLSEITKTRSIKLKHIDDLPLEYPW